MAIVKRGGSYQVKIRGSDSKWLSKAFKSLREAKEFETEQKQKKNKGESVTSKSQHTTLNDYWLDWFKTSCQASEGWKIKLAQKYRDYIQPILGNLKLNQIKPAHVSLVLQKMKEKGMSEQMRVHVYGLLHKMFEDSISDFQILSSNPVSKKLKPQIHKKESEYLEFEDSAYFLNWVKSKRYGLAIWLQLYLGPRACEVVFLRWHHIDFKNSLLHVRGTYRRSEKRMVDYPKGGEWHSLKIPGELLEFLKEQKALATSDWVETSVKDASKHMSYGTYASTLKRYVKESGVNPKISSHCLRHSTHGIYMEHGATEEDMQQLFAHKSANTTKLYLHGQHKRKKRVDEIAASIRLF